MLSLSWVLVPAILKGFIDFFVAGNYKCNVAEDVADDDVVVGSFYQGRKIEKAKAKTIFPLFSFFFTAVTLKLTETSIKLIASLPSPSPMLMLLWVRVCGCVCVGVCDNAC